MGNVSMGNVEDASAQPVSVMILAGGQSRRMGQDKALLPVRGGRPLLSQTVEIAGQLSASIVIVTSWPDRYRPLLLSQHSGQRVDFVAERLEQPARGPLGGFAQGWAQVSSPWCLLLACDLPYLEAPVLQRWWQSLALLAETPPDGCLPLPPMASLVPIKNKGNHHHQSEQNKSDKQWEPLCGFYHRRCLPSLHRYLDGGGRSFQRWLSGVTVAPFYESPENMLFNCNTPADWAAVSLG